MPDIVYALKQPYPVPRDLPPNRRWAMLLSEHYAGQASELTAVTQYIYHHIALAGAQPEIAKALRGIAIVEMRHLDLLGDLIRRLGLRPEYRSWRTGRPRDWSVGAVRYGQNLREMLRLDLEGEDRAIQNYRETMRLIPDPQIRALLERFVTEEELHIQILSSMLASL